MALSDGTPRINLQGFSLSMDAKWRMHANVQVFRGYNANRWFCLLVPSRFVLEFDWRGFRLDEDTWSGKVNRLIGEFLGQALPSVHFAHRDLT